MKIDLKYIPIPNQVRAHLATETYILYGGAVGGGKSCWLVNDALRQALAYSGNRVGIYRYENAAYTKTTHLEVKRWILGVPGLVKAHNKNDHTITLINDSEIVYGGLKPSATVSGDLFSTVKSLALNAIYFDEVSDFPQDLYDFACTRVPRHPCIDPRTGALCHPPARVAASSNPTMGWIKTRWVDQPPENHIFIPSAVKDNIYLPAEYEQLLRDKYAAREDWIERFLEGDWSASMDSACLCHPMWLERARRNRQDLGVPIEFGVDIAAGGADKTVIIRRRGMVADVILAQQGLPDTMKTVDVIAEMVNKYNPSLIKIDNVGVGQGVFDRMAELGYPVLPMNGGMKSHSPDKYANKRAEWYWEFRILLERNKITIPNMDEVINELGDIKHMTTASGRCTQIESKKDIIKRLGHSPDYADAMVYCFAGAGELTSLSLLL